jgi:hypothetical protein
MGSVGLVTRIRKHFGRSVILNGTRLADFTLAYGCRFGEMREMMVRWSAQRGGTGWEGGQ